MGLINAFIDALDKKWGEQAMQKKLNEKDKIIEELQKENQNLRQAPETRRRRGRRRWDGQPDLNQSHGEMRIRRILGDRGRTDFNVRTVEL